jgi:probable rRNA maturation factor
MTRTATKNQPLKLQLSVQNEVGAKTPSPSRAQVRRWVSAALERDVSATIRFVSEEDIRAMNAQFRGKDYATNVLTFVYETAPRVWGDIAICPAIIAKEAKAQQKTLHAHYAHMVMHGVLHLQGYDHERAREAETMEARERVLLKRFRIDDPYVER